MKKLFVVLIAIFMAAVTISCEAEGEETVSKDGSAAGESVVSVDSDTTSDVESFDESLPDNDSSVLSEEESSAVADETSEEEISAPEHSEEICDPESYGYAKQMYTEFLLNGGYDDVLYIGNFEHDTVKLYTYMLDLNGDGGYELFIKSLIGYSERYCALLGIEDGTVKVLAVAEEGGSMGGSYLDYMYDSKNDKRVMVYRGNIRAGGTAQGGHFYVLSNDELYSGTEEAPAYSVKHDSSKLHLSYMADMIAQIKAVTDVYTEDEEYFYAYEINGVYVEKDEYESSIKNYSSIELDFYEGSLEEPIR